MLNRTEFIESFLAINKLGAIAVPVNFRMTPPEIAFLVSDCQAEVVITESVLANVATAVRDIDRTLVPLMRIVWVDAAFHTRAMAALLAAGRRKLSLVDCVSFEVMREGGITSAFTLDPDFRAQGFERIP